MSQVLRSHPLSGIRVLDLTRLLPGPLCGQHLADLGADVIKIEDTGLGDYVRPSLRPMLNRGKRGLQLNLKLDEGKTILRKLAQTSDVLIESFRPGVMARLGVGYEQLRELNPRLVFCSITGYGQEGSRASAAGHDLNYVGLSGLLDQAAFVDGIPGLPGFQIGDILGGTLSATVGVLAALLDARSSGAGRHVDVSMADAVLAHCVLPVGEINSVGAESRQGRGLNTGASPRYNVYRTRDGHFLAVGAQEKQFWDEFCRVLERSDLSKLDAVTGENANQIKREIATEINKHTLEEWLARFRASDCCVTPVRSISEAVQDEDMRKRGTVDKRDQEYRLGLPFLLSEFAIDLFRPSPARGEDTDTILRELGYTDDQLRKLRSSGVV